MVYERTIHLADTDAAGVVYFASLLSICHEAYEASLATSGISLTTFLNDASFALPIVHAEIDFFRPLYCGDRIRIVLETHQLSDNEFEIKYQVVGSQAEKTFAKAKTRHVCIHPIQRLRTSLPPAIVTWLQ